MLSVDPPSLKNTKTGPRASVSLHELRTPNLLSILPIGHEKAFKYALYNVVALVLSAVLILALWTVYTILEPFIKPLLWALLCGTCLHPFKANLSFWARSWLSNVKKSRAPFVLHLIITPFSLADSLSDKIGIFVWDFWKSIIGAVSLFFFSYIIYYNPPLRLVNLCHGTMSILFQIFYWSLSWINWQLILTLNCIYLGYIAHFFYLSMSMDKNSESPDIKNNSKDEVDTTSAEETENKKDLMKPAPLNIISSTLAEPKYMTKILSYTTWGSTFIFIYFNLPYTLQLIFLVLTILGAVSYLKGSGGDSEKSKKYTISTLSKYAYIVARNIGSPAPNIPQLIKTSTPLISDSSYASGSSPAETESAFIANERRMQRSFSLGANFESKDSNKSPNVSFLPSPISPSPFDFPDDSIDGSPEGAFIETNKCLYAVLTACIVVQVWNRLWLLHLIPIPIVYYGLKKIWKYLQIPELIKKHVTNPFVSKVDIATKDHKDKFFPPPLNACLKILVEGDKKLVSVCEEYIDPFISSLLLILVVILTILGLIFASVQIYGEGDHLVRVSANLINSTVSSYPQINKILPQGWEGVLDSMVGNAYLTGREYITNWIRDTIEEKSPEKAEKIEEQVIELWDRIYLAWNKTWDVNKLEEQKLQEQGIEWDELLERGKEMPLLLDFSLMANYAKANLGTIWSILETLWTILVSNISLVLSASTAMLSVLLGGGSALLNLLLNLVVFFTTLFYLLSSSSKSYKPVELFNKWTAGAGPEAQNFSTAVEEAINGVFTASFKMSAFYGMWTWLIHTIFEVNIVFIPSVFAAIFGAVPILGPYWAALPAVLELWLIQGHWTKALLMLLAQLAPMSIVDTQIYREIKGGGHPYLTGLAVAGGIFCYGFQGAIMGPLVLCCFFVGVKVGNSFLRDDQSLPTENNQNNLGES